MLKVFDVETRALACLLLDLSPFYASSSICKPRTSRASNGERYALFTGFLGGPAAAEFASRLMRLSSGAAAAASPLALSLSELSYFRQAHSAFGKAQAKALKTTIDVVDGKVCAAVNLADRFWAEHAPPRSSSR